MTAEPEQDREEARLAALLRSVEADAPPPDRALLAALRERSLAAFAESADSAIVYQPPRRAALQKKRSPMFTLAIRGLAAVAVSAVAAVALLNFGQPKAVSGAPFSDVVAELRTAKTLQLRVLKAGRAAEILIRSPGLVRYEESSQKYRISAGSRLWQIDESTNTATTGDSPWFLNPAEQVDLLGLLEVGVTDAAPLLNSHPSGKSQYDGLACDVYAVELPAKNGPLHVEAFTDPATKRLLGITARAAGSDAKAGPPLAELQLVAMNGPVDDTKFIVAKSLTEDGRIGKVSDAQGVVVLRPMFSQRWTPICRETLLKPGDWLRTDIRGANAVKVRFSSDVELTLGPGTLLECISPTQARIHTGETQVNIPKSEKNKDGKEQTQVAFELLAPRAGSQKLSTPGKVFLRVDRTDKLAEIKQPPKWLAGFEGTSANESLGSLIVNLPDGRNEPLSVGYHKVSVEIRDQIARTTIEESFVNHTSTRLEGVFHFPLPQDASISGFGMWIGDKLVEADVVEKQRAREIYEAILREKRDPGLLEWTSGNLFKARVFPIEPNSEKRIKIVYTQVLPLRANKYRYTYGLRSDLLRMKPVRELSLKVMVESAIPLKTVTCTTHPARTQQTAHAATVEFAAQEYAPDRDFEVVAEIDGRQSDVVVVPHRRGDDGYLLVQLTPPSPAGNWQREVLPDGAPLEIVLLCDTSASMDSEKRKQQAEFVATVLSSLGDKDHFMLAACDVATAWAAPEPLAPTADNIAKARDFLDNRVSLGWTNLDQAFEAVLQRAPAGAQIVYIGDGIVTAGDRDPASFVKRLAKMIADKMADQKAAPAWTLHGVTVGNVNDATVMKGIATVGGGSTRAIGGEQTPQAVALEWLNEIAQPGLRDLNVEFRGVKVAALYPERLPNVAAGTQQILVGRYLPTGKDQQGEIIVTGKRGTEPVRFAAKINFADAEAGNSFIPRLWARSQLGFLLQQGSNQTIRDDIIALSEEFHIITPYTSLVVLETDADRERFAVKRRYEMRDGERFFAEGKAGANFDLAQQQIKRAADWRLGLRRQIMTQLATLGRNPQMFQQSLMKIGTGSLTLSGFNTYSGGTTINGGTFRIGAGATLGTLDGIGIISTSFNGIVNNEDGYGKWGVNNQESDEEISQGRIRSRSEMDPNHPGGADAGWSNEVLSADGSVEFLGDDNGKISLGLKGEKHREEFARDEFNGPIDGPVALDPQSGEGDFITPQLETSLSMASSATDYRRSFDSNWRGGQYYADEIENDKYFTFHDRGYLSPNYTNWVSTLFPTLAGRPGKPLALKDSPTWSPEALALSKSLSRQESLQKLTGGIELTTVARSFDPIWKRTSSQMSDLTVYAPTAWLTKPLNGDSQTIVNYCDKKVRGVFSLAFLLGQTRPSVERDLTTPPFGLNDWSLAPLHETYRGYIARVEKAGENQATLILTVKNSTYEQHYLIDTARHVVLQGEGFLDGKSTGITKFSDFVEVGGSWWAKKSESLDAKERKIAEATHEVKALAQNEFDERMKAELAVLPTVQLLRHPFATLSDARQHVANGAATFEDRIAMILFYCQSQQWDEVLMQLDEVEKGAADKPGVRWLRTVIFAMIRRNEEARQRLLDEAKQLAAKPQQDEVFLADFILGQSQSINSPAEFLDVLNLLKPVYDRQPAGSSGRAALQERLANSYESLGRLEESLTIRKTLAEQTPWDVSKQADLSRRLLQTGQADDAYAWLDKQLGRPELRAPYESDTLRTAYADLYRTQARWADLLKFTTDWLARKPETATAYQQHLAAMIYNEQLDAANALVEQWLKEGRIERKFTPDQAARLDAAIAYAQGTAYNLQFYRTQERWSGPLEETARFFARQADHLDIAQRILDYRMFETDSGDRLRAYCFGPLQTDLEKLTPDQISYLLGNAMSGRLEFAEPLNGRRQMSAAEVPDELWKKIAAQLRARWEKAEDKDGKYEKHGLSESLRAIYAARFAETELLPFLRERIKTATPEMKPSDVSALFDVLLSRKWSDEIEKEAFSLLPQLSNAEEAPVRLAVQLAALYRLDDAMLASRQAHANEELRDKGNVDKLTRKQLADKRAEFRKGALTGLAKRLSEQADQAEKEKDPLANWFKIEQTWLDVQLDQNFDKILAFCWTQLGELPPKPDANAAADEDILLEKLHQEALDGLLRQRAFATVINLAARQSADPKAIDRLVKYIDAGLAQGPDVAAAWRRTKFQLLVALDRPDDLERELRAWIRDDVTTAPWRKYLALLVAERGKLDEAIQLFEACEKDHLLAADDYRTLATWYQTQNRHEAYERARYESFKILPEQYLSRLVGMYCNRWNGYNNQPLPTELDENTLLAFKALFEKSASPGNYVSSLRQLYTACRDFRLLQMVPDAMLGRTSEQIYPFLQQVQNNLLAEMRNESTADEIVARIKKLREGDRTPTDLRALDLFEAMVERQSSEVQNQKGPHVEACLAAMKRAFARKWSAGEPRLMSGFLANLGHLPVQKLQDEQLRELRELLKAAPADSRDHLHMTGDLSRLLYSTYYRQVEGTQLLEAEIAGYEQAHQGQWPHEDDDVLGQYIDMLQNSGMHTAGEIVLQKYFDRSHNAEQRKWLKDRLWSLYNNALATDGEVSLGKGEVLFDALVTYGLKQIDAAADENVRQEAVYQLVQTFSVARYNNQLSGVVHEPLRKFAFETMPKILKRQQSQYRGTVDAPVTIIRQALGTADEVRYLVERMEQWPQHLQVTQEGAWRVLGNQLTEGRIRLGSSADPDAKDLEPRVLKLAIAELKQYLITGESADYSMFNCQSSEHHFWAEKADDFAAAAEDVYRQHKTSGRRVMFVANYLWYGLTRGDRAIEMLFVAHKDGLLDVGGQQILIGYLRVANRYAEAISLLEPLVRDLPDDMYLRTQLMNAYSLTQRPEQLAELVKQTEQHFHGGGRWSEGNIVQFAQACLSCHLDDKAIGYFNEAISAHQRANPDAGLGDSTLSSWYVQLANAHSALHHTKEAVDAASAAIVCWGPHQSQRAAAVGRLNDVLNYAANLNAKDDPRSLDAYVKNLDEETAKTGQDSPLLRKTIGRVYQHRNAYAKAIVQLDLARQLQPNDKETYQALIACYDALKQPREATKQLLALVDFDRHDLKLYEQLAERFKDDKPEAERAATSIIEAGPTEAENHQALAELRQKQNRWDEAIAQWREVAELRRLEPNGWLKLTEAEIHQKQWPAARESLEKLSRTEWPSRFNDVQSQIQRLLSMLPK